MESLVAKDWEEHVRKSSFSAPATFDVVVIGGGHAGCEAVS